MAEQGSVSQAGQPIMGLGSDGKCYFVAIDPATGQLLIQLEPSSTNQPIEDGVQTDASGTLTASGQSVTASNVDGFATVTFSLSGTYAGLTAVFEQSDDSGVTWYSVDAAQIGAGVVENGCTNLTNTNRMWRATVSGSDSFRIRCTALTSGTVSVLISISALPTGNGAAVTTNFSDLRPASGTITTQDLASSTATGQNSASIITGTPTANSSFSYAVNGVAGIYALVTGTWTGTLQFEKSIDGGTTYTPSSVHVDSTAFTQVAITGNCSVRGASAGATNFRVRATAAMTGTATVRFVFAAADTVVTVNNAPRLFDNTSGASATIKLASTAALATDTALVVAVAPSAGSIAKAEDVASADGDVGIPAMAVQKATPVDTAGTDGDYSILQMSLGRLWASATIHATSVAGGIPSTARLPSAAASTNATNVKTTAGRIYAAQGKNTAAYDVFLVLYDSATNPPVPGTTTIRKKIPCPAGATFALDWPLGLSFATGIGYAFTKLVADADTTVLVAADIIGFNIDYA